MKTRGKILRAPGSGAGTGVGTSPGLVMIDGQQFRFAAEGIWRSVTPPRPGLNVQVELDDHQRVAGITVIPDPDLLLTHKRIARKMRKRRGPEAPMWRVARFTVPALIAGVLLLVIWFWL